VERFGCGRLAAGKEIPPKNVADRQIRAKLGRNGDAISALGRDVVWSNGDQELGEGARKKDGKWRIEKDELPVGRS